MSGADKDTEISPRLQEVARLSAGVLAGLGTFAVLTIVVPGAGWEIAPEPSPLLPPAEGSMYFTEGLAIVAALLTYMVLSFWAAMEPSDD